MEQAPRLAIWPGLAISIVIYGTNMSGDAIRDLLDPQLGGGRYGGVDERKLQKARRKASAK